MTYDVNYFIEKFEKIPEERWCSRVFGLWNIHCALGHCGVRLTLTDTDFEAKALVALFYNKNNEYSVTAVNDGDTYRYQQPTPKQRILAALYDIKANQAVTEANKILSEPVKEIV